jgi:imidazolonepropionase-like amidohydrolase
MLRRAAVEAARNWGIHVAAHVYDSGGVRRAIDNPAPDH